MPGRIPESAQCGRTSGTGNRQNWHPEPRIIPQTAEARQILDEAGFEGEAEYTRAESHADAVGTAVWGRVAEHARKSALIHAASEERHEPEIGGAAGLWARRFVMHQARRVLFVTQVHVVANPFHAGCLKLLEKLREAPGQELAHRVLFKRMKTDAKTFQALVSTLEQRGDLVGRIEAVRGAVGWFYRLVGGSPEPTEW